MNRPSVDALRFAAGHYLLIPLASVATFLGAVALVRFSLIGGGGEFFDPTTAVAGHFAAVLLVALQMAFGWRVFSLLGWDELLERPVERALFSWTAGFVASTSAALALAAASLLSRGSVLLCTAALALFAAPSAIAAVRALVRSQRSAWSCFDRSRLPALGLAAIASALALAWLWPLGVQTLLPNASRR